MNSPLKAALSYPKFCRESLTILTWSSQVLVIGECIAALQKMGHHVVTIDLLRNEEPPIKTLLRALVSHRPDFVLSVNHSNFDAGGQLGAFLDEFEIPTAVWYVDNPMFNIKGNPFPAPKMTTVFSWEKMLIPHIKESFGIEDVHYLPLATHPDWFHPRGGAVIENVTFCGDSMIFAEQKWRSMLSPPLWEAAKHLGERIFRAPRESAYEFMFPSTVNSGTLDEKWNQVTAATWLSSSRYRLERLSAVAKDGLTVFGDPGWSTRLPSATCKGPVRYGDALSMLYESSAVSVNVTSLQMPSAVNQRVFDVPASGGFLLTDDVADAALHFEPGKELVLYKSPEELETLSRYYLAHEAERRKISERARSRILESHTYIARMEHMLSVLNMRHGMTIRKQ